MQTYIAEALTEEVLVFLPCQIEWLMEPSSTAVRYVCVLIGHHLYPPVMS